MFGFITFILLLPIIIYWGCRILLEDGHSVSLYMENWVKSSAYYVGKILGCIGKCALPSTEELTASLKDENLSDAFSKGVKEVWK